MRTTRLGLLVAAIGTLTLACSDDGDGGLRADTESIDSSGPESADSGSGDTTTGDDGGSGSGEVLGSSEASLRANAIDNRSTSLRMDVVRLERHGDLVELSLVLTNEVEPQDEDTDPQDFSIDTLFGDDYDAGGIGLVDGDAQKLYLPVLDSDGTCLCSGEFGASDIPPGGTKSIDATYGGVPDDVETLDVRVPNFPTIAEVPVG
jgi:hypothetical protein